MARTLDPAEQRRLLERLADGQWHGGDELAEDFGIGRAALSKRVEQLREAGLAIESLAGRGYRLQQRLDLLDQAVMREAAGAALDGVKLSLLDWTDSTNAQLLAADSQQDPQLLLAEGQTAGRGRRGRSWIAPYAANLNLSLAWKFADWPPQLPALSLAIGVALWRHLRQLGLQPHQLKWPNDLWLGGAKLAGILIEHRGEVGGPCRVVVGVGLNVYRPPAEHPQPDQAWTSLDQHLPDFGGRSRLAGGLAAALIVAVREFAASGLQSFTADFARADLLANQAITVSDAKGERQGIARGIDGQGALRMEAGGQIRSLYSGEISVRPQALQP